MKIAFWSPRGGQTGVTSNLLAIAIITVLTYNKNVYLTHFNFRDKTMEYALLGGNIQGAMFENIGLDAFIRNLKNTQEHSDIIRNGAFSLLNNRLHLLPGSTKENKNLFEIELKPAVSCIVHSMEKESDLVFLDLPSGQNEISERLLEEADLIFVNLNQNKLLIQEYFKNYSLISDKTIYLISNYQPDSKYNYKNLLRGFEVFRKKSYVIPYDTGYMDAVSDGKVINYLIKNLIYNNNSSSFHKEIKKVVERIIEAMEREAKLCDI